MGKCHLRTCWSAIPWAVCSCAVLRARTPDLVAGVVLVDSPDELVVFRDNIRPFYAQGMRMQRVLGIFARLGLLRLLGRRIPMLMLPDDPVGYALCATPKHARAAADEMQAMFMHRKR